MIGSSGASFVTGAMILAPSTGWAFMIARSSLRQPVRLVEDAVGHADLADVVEQPAPLQRFELLLATRITGRCRRRSPGPAGCGPLVNVSRSSTAPARLATVWVNISRISM